MKNNLMYRSLLLVICVCLSWSTIFAQDKTISGTVKDDLGVPLIGVNVVVEGTETGTVTDMDGNFTIQVPEGATLLFSYIGFLNEQVVVSTQTNLEIQLLPDLAELDEVVVIGYGQVRKKDLTGSVATVSSDDFKQGAVTSPEQLIVGKISGVQITSGGGDPGSKQNIRIRGGASINASNDPLYVVDGIPLDNDDADGLANPFSSLNPNDIESISVLKDASATAIYGSRASNGVIIITTKKGTAHAPLKLSYNGKFSINQVTKKVDVLDADQFREAVSTYVSESNRDNAISLLGNESTEWQDEIYRNSYDMEHSFSASGAINKLPYRVSVGYLSQDGILKTGYMDRTTLRASISPSLFDDHLQLNINASGAWLENRFANKDAIGAAVQFDPTKPVYEDNNFNGYYAWTTPDTIPAAERVRTVGQATKNPVALLEEKEDRSNVYRTTGNFSADYKLHFLPELKLHVNAGYDGYHSDGTIEVPATSAIEFDNAENPKGGGTLRDYSQSKENTLLDVYLNYNRELNSVESRIDATAGYSYQKFWKISKTFETNHIPTANDSVLKKDTDGAQEAVLISFFGRLNYSLKDKYLVTFTLREDGSSRFSENNRWGLFPSVALAWNVSNESFLSSNDVLSQLKLRLGYGITGQQDISSNFYPYQGKYSLSTVNASYLMGNTYYQAFRADGYDENIKWEETTTYNVGLDYGLYKERIFGSVDFYLKKTVDLINEIPVPAGSNLTNRIITNVGDMENRGVEFDITSRIVSTRDWLWEVNANATYNQNKITKLTNYNDPDFLGIEDGGISGGVGNNIQIYSVDQPVKTFFVYEQVYDTEGNPIEGMYVDRNDDGEVNEKDKYHTDDAHPDVYLGISSKVQYKNLTFSFAGRAQFGNYVYYNVSSNDGELSRLFRPEGPYISNVHSSALDTKFKAPKYFSDYYIQNASFFRMDDITLSYRIPKLLDTKLNIAISATVNNAFVITKYDGLDPEVFEGIDNNLYPRPRVFLMGLNVQF